MHDVGGHHDSAAFDHWAGDDSADDDHTNRAGGAEPPPSQQTLVELVQFVATQNWSGGVLAQPDQACFDFEIARNSAAVREAVAELGDPGGDPFLWYSLDDNVRKAILGNYIDCLEGLDGARPMIALGTINTPEPGCVVDAWGTTVDRRFVVSSLAVGLQELPPDVLDKLTAGVLTCLAGRGVVEAGCSARARGVEQLHARGSGVHRGAADRPVRRRTVDSSSAADHSDSQLAAGPARRGRRRRVRGRGRPFELGRTNSGRQLHRPLLRRRGRVVGSRVRSSARRRSDRGRRCDGAILGLPRFCRTRGRDRRDVPAGCGRDAARR